MSKCDQRQQQQQQTKVLNTYIHTRARTHFVRQNAIVEKFFAASLLHVQTVLLSNAFRLALS